MDLGIEGRIALVGGASQGIGRAVAEVLIAEGAQVVITARDEARSATLAAYKTLALAVAGDGVTVNTLLTGSIATDRAASLHGSMQAAEQAAAERVPVGRIGRPEEMGWAAAFLCSERAGFITGSALAVDGGVLRGI